MKSNINPNDLKKIAKNLEFIFNKPFPELEENQQKMVENNPKEILSLIYFFVPPKTVADLIDLRDSKQQHLALYNCKSGHNIMICCFC